MRKWIIPIGIVVSLALMFCLQESYIWTQWNKAMRGNLETTSPDVHDMTAKISGTLDVDNGGWGAQLGDWHCTLEYKNREKPPVCVHEPVETQ